MRTTPALGEQAWRESGLAAPADIDALNQKISQMEQQVIDLRLQLEEQGDDLAAARAEAGPLGVRRPRQRPLVGVRVEVQGSVRAIVQRFRQAMEFIEAFGATYLR
jgi:hypothetical protein